MGVYTEFRALPRTKNFTLLLRCCCFSRQNTHVPPVVGMYLLHAPHPRRADLTDSRATWGAVWEADLTCRPTVTGAARMRGAEPTVPFATVVSRGRR